MKTISPSQKEITNLTKLFTTGQYVTAEKVCRELLQTDNESLVLLNLLGGILMAQKKPMQALTIFKQILALAPDEAKGYNNQGLALKDVGQLHEAVKSYDRAILLQPDFPQVYNNRANVLKDLGQINEAIINYHKAIQLNNNYLKAYTNLGVALQEIGHLDEALQSYDKAIQLKPDFAELYNNRGNLLKDKGQLEDALINYETAISLKPGYAQAYYNKGLVLEEFDQFNEAVNMYNSAISLNPDYASAYTNLANVQQEIGKVEEAITNYAKATVLKPTSAEIYNNYALALRSIGQEYEAINNYNKAISLKPNFAEVYNNLGNAYKDIGQLEEALNNYDKAIQLKPEHIITYSNRCFLLNYFHNLTQKKIYDEHLKLEKIFEKKIVHNDIVSKSTNERIRVGYISADFKVHSVAYFFEPLLRSHNKKLIDVFCYYDNQTIDDTTKRLIKKSEHWRSVVDMDDFEVIKLIKKDNIDILVDMAGHTGQNRLIVFSYKPAPIQITWLGYPNTTGLSTIDYRFTDDVADPIGESDKLHTEKLIRLENGFLCYQGDDTISNTGLLPCVKKGNITFGSFNNTSKLNKHVIRVWSEILHGVPNSNLILKSKQLIDINLRNQYLKLFEQEGISNNRIKLYARLSNKKDHLKLYNLVDICLDPFPYNGTTTTCEALWMGVPVITMLGNRHSSRVGATIMTHVGLKEFIAKDECEYIDLAVKSVKKLDYIADLRRNLRKKMNNSELCNSYLFARNIEKSYCKMMGELKSYKSKISSVENNSLTIEVKSIKLKIVSNINIIVPDSYKYMTTYVLAEQKDWFEDEMCFIRNFIKPEMNCIDIGANHGVYTLNMAKCLENTGHIWSFEPTKLTYNYLESSIKSNQFENITAINKGLSNKQGKAKLYVSMNSELNSLSKTLSSNQKFEEISLVTIDQCLKKYNWENIDFLKLDAEGEEYKILSKGKKFFSKFSPLVMFELKHGNEVNLSLITNFKSLGYDSYRLIPGQNILVKFDHELPFDRYILNIFCCKKEKAKQLQIDGFIAIDSNKKLYSDIKLIGLYLKKHVLYNYIDHPLAFAKHEGKTAYFSILFDYIMSLQKGIKKQQRLQYLFCALDAVKAIIEKNERQSSHRLSTYSRIAFDAGERAFGITILSVILKQMESDSFVDIDEFFFPASSVYDKIHPDNKVDNWLYSSVIEQYINKHAFSTYFTKTKTLPLFEKLASMEFMTKEMKKRYELVKSCFS